MRIGVVEGDSAGEIADLLRECGHEAVLRSDALLAAARPGGIDLPLVVVTDRAAQPRPERISELQAAGWWVLAAARPDRLATFADADDLLPLPSTAAELRARLLVAQRAVVRKRKPIEDLAEVQSRFDWLAGGLRSTVFWISDWPSGRVVYVSPSFEEIWGRSVKELLTAAPAQTLRWVHPDDQRRIEEVRAEGGSGWEIEYRILRPDGSVRWIRGRAAPLRDPDGVVRRMAGLSEDVTERRLAEEALAESEARFRELADSTDQVFWIVDLSTRRPIYVSPAYERVWKRNAAELLSGAQRFRDTILREDVPALLAAFEAATGGADQEVELRMVLPDGATRWIRTKMHPVRDASGTVIRIAGIGEDITDRRAAHDVQARLMLSERLASVGTLAGGVAHEINNPLAVTLANLEFSLQELDEKTAEPDLPEMRQALREAREGAERVRQIVRDLHVFARADGERRQPLSVSRIVESALAMTANEIRHRARAVRDFAPDLPPVEANEQQLGQVVINLLMNAVQAIPVGNAANNEVRVRTAMAGGRVLLEVADTGSGIPPENLPRIFDPFFTTKPPGHGTGLGLSMCHSIVMSLGGEIQVESSVGKGTTMRVLLRPAAGAVVAERVPSASAAPARRGRILVVDDEPMLVRTLERILVAEHDVLATTSAREALERIRGGERYDVILCDLMMPEMTGMELYAELGKTMPDQQKRMVFVTGGAFTPTAQQFLEAVSQPWVQKPFEAAQLKEVIAARLS